MYMLYIHSVILEDYVHVIHTFSNTRRLCTCNVRGILEDYVLVMSEGYTRRLCTCNVSGILEDYVHVMSVVY